MVFGIADMNFGLGDMNSYTKCRLCAPLAPVNVGVEEGDADNSVEIIVFGNIEISHPFNHVVPEWQESIYENECL